ncbi:hypothetical protein [uncultured Thiodictyon sp.]|uniref:hypothetical protein n=1 Tax=uncultured Thiodictyon sp. TaxID=1846217 RepID=UPI0025E8340A|nr:hypothetical protein [uncultured Thiodictyon sp.]
MYTYPIHSRDSRTAPQFRTAGPSKPAPRDSIAQDLMVAEMIANAFNDNASQLYRGI